MPYVIEVRNLTAHYKKFKTVVYSHCYPACGCI